MSFEPIGATPIGYEEDIQLVNYLLTAAPIAVASPVFGAVYAPKTQALLPVGFAVASPVFDKPGKLPTQVIPVGDTTISPVLGAPVFKGVVALAPVGIAVARPQIGGSRTFTTAGITTASPGIGQPGVVPIDQTFGAVASDYGPIGGSPIASNTGESTAGQQLSVVGAGSLTVGSPDLPGPGFAQKQIVSAPQGVAVAPPAPMAPVLNQIDKLTPVGITVASPERGLPVLTMAARLTGSGLPTASPQLGAASLRQVHVITATGITTASPTGFIWALQGAMAASDLTVGSPILTGPTLRQKQVIVSTGLTVSSPDLGGGRLLYLTAPNFAVDHPFLGAPGPTQTYHIAAQGIVTLSPVLSRPVVIGEMRAVGITIKPAEIGEASLVNPIGTTDFWLPQINLSSGSDLIYRAAAGLEKAMADVDAMHLVGTYAELIRDQWDPYAISQRNLPLLAWAMGVNLWEDIWGTEFKRWWVAQQWTLKAQRGSLYGTERFVAAVNNKVVGAIVPPAKFYPGKSMTEAERLDYISRFAQLRVYPFAGRTQLPYLCFIAKLPAPLNGPPVFNKNGKFLGPLREFFPTSQDAGGRYMRLAEIWDHGQITPLTMRVIVSEDMGPYGVTKWDEVTLPARKNNHWYLDQENKWPLPMAHPIRQNKYGIFLGAMDDTASRVVRIPRDGSLDLAQGKAQYQTIKPGNDLVGVYPEYKADKHPTSKYKLYAGGAKVGQYMRSKYLPTTNSWQYLYEVWYLFDPLRVPDYRRASIYMGHARLGIQKYTAELKIDAHEYWRPWFLTTQGFMRGFLHPKDTTTIDRLRRAVTASMAIRDTVHINTVVKRVINTNDSLPCNGEFTVGEMVDA
jgi:phage tail P2-like protein